VKLQMQDFVKIDLAPSAGLSNAFITGDIELKQRNPLQARYLKRVCYLPSSTITRNIYNTSLFDDPSQNVNVITLQEDKINRNGIDFITT
jgi:hypothetical protein